MVNRVMCAVMAAVVLTAPAVWAGSGTELIQSERMTVVKVDEEAGAVMFKNSVSVGWMLAPAAMVVAPGRAKRDLMLLHPGDIVRVQGEGIDQTITILRYAAEEIGSPEK